MRQTLIVDASYSQASGITGIGIYVHETDRPKRNGVLIDKIAESYLGINAGQGEQLAIYRALEIAMERGFRTVRIRSDYNLLRRVLKRDMEGGSELHRGDFHGRILRIVQHFDSVQFAHKPRRKNQMAHTFARRATTELQPIHRTELMEMSNWKNVCGQPDACRVFHAGAGEA